MSKRRWIAAGAALFALTGGVALATAPVGLFSQLQARGTYADQGDAGKLALRMWQRASELRDVAIVRATIDPGGTTGWHGHPGPSVAIVKSGTVTVYEPDARRGSPSLCSVRRYTAGQAFFHPEEVHAFSNESRPLNEGGTIVELWIAYFVPNAVGLLRDEPKPAACAGLGP